MKSMRGRFFYLVFTLMFSSVAVAQTAEVTYISQIPVPVFGTFGLLVMGLVLALTGYVFLKKRSDAFQKLTVTAITVGLLTSAGAGGWLVKNAEAVISATEYLFSENSNPVIVTSFPAAVTNDLGYPATILSVEVSGCPGEIAITGTCEPDVNLSENGGSCSLDSVCESIGAQQCDTGNDIYTNSPWVVCEASANEAWVSADDGGQYNADVICQELGYDRADQAGGTCGNVCGYCEAPTSCSAPGTKIFDGNGVSTGPYGMLLATTVMWTCVNDPL